MQASFINHLNNNSSLPSSLSKNYFKICPNWLYPLKVRFCSQHNVAAKDFKAFMDEIFNHENFIKQMPIKEILRFLSLEVEEIGSLMHYLVICKHSMEHPPESVNLSIKCIEEKCNQELSLEEKEQYLNLKNSENLTYKELDQQLLDKKIKDLFFHALEKKLQELLVLYDQQSEISCDPEDLIEACKKNTIDSKALRFRANRDLRGDNGQVLLVRKGDTLLNVAALLFLNRQVPEDYLMHLYLLAFSKRNHGGNHFLAASTVDKMTNLAHCNSLLKLVYQSSKSHFEMNLLNCVTTDNIEKIKKIILPNLGLLFEKRSSNINFFWHFLERISTANKRSVILKNFSSFFKILGFCSSLERSTLSKDVKSICMSRAKDYTFQIYCIFNDKTNFIIFLELFFACPEFFWFEEDAFFNFHAPSSIQFNYRNQQVPIYEGDTLLHIAVRMHQLNLMSFDLIEKLINKAIFSSFTYAQACLRWKNSQNKQFRDVAIGNVKTQIDDLLLSTFTRYFDQLFEIPISNLYSPAILSNIKLINSGVFPLKKVSDYFFHFVDRLDGSAESQLAEENLNKLIKIFKNESFTTYAGACKKVLCFVNKEGLSFLDYAEKKLSSCPFLGRFFDCPEMYENELIFNYRSKCDFFLKRCLFIREILYFTSLLATICQQGLIK